MYHERRGGILVYDPLIANQQGQKDLVSKIRNKCLYHIDTKYISTCRSTSILKEDKVIMLATKLGEGSG
jgi:hypothetical protein